MDRALDGAWVFEQIHRAVSMAMLGGVLHFVEARSRAAEAPRPVSRLVGQCPVCAAGAGLERATRLDNADAPRRARRPGHAVAPDASIFSGLHAGGDRSAPPSFPRRGCLGFDCLLEAFPAERPPDLLLQHGSPAVRFLSALHPSRTRATELDRAVRAAAAVPDGRLLGLAMACGRTRG